MTSPWGFQWGPQFTGTGVAHSPGIPWSQQWGPQFTGQVGVSAPSPSIGMARKVKRTYRLQAISQPRWAIQEKSRASALVDLSGRYDALALRVKSLEAHPIIAGYERMAVNGMLQTIAKRQPEEVERLRAEYERRTQEVAALKNEMRGVEAKRIIAG